MSSLLKDLYSVAFYDKFSTAIGNVVPSFDKRKFNALIFDDSWKHKELKDRMKHTSFVLHHFLSGDFSHATKEIEKIIQQLRQLGVNDNSFEYMFFPDYIEKYGIDEFDAAVRSMEFVTCFTSCEFAVRPFIIKYGSKMIDKMLGWSLHSHANVRRLASEGMRPRLPWAMAVPELKKDPSVILPILENLKNDPSETVRRSVANNLNDVSKDHPAVVISIAKKWKGISKDTDALIKHGCRTLLKQGNKEILAYYGLNNSSKIKVSKFSIYTPKVNIGKELKFGFTIQNSDTNPQTVRLEYGIYYLKQNGQLSKKVFKISERQLSIGEALDVIRKQSFRLITTRKFYPGNHKLSVIVNGVEKEMGDFELMP